MTFADFRSQLINERSYYKNYLPHCNCDKQILQLTKEINRLTAQVENLEQVPFFMQLTETESVFVELESKMNLKLQK